MSHKQMWVYWEIQVHRKKNISCKMVSGLYPGFSVPWGQERTYSMCALQLTEMRIRGLAYYLGCSARYGRHKLQPETLKHRGTASYR